MVVVDCDSSKGKVGDKAVNSIFCRSPAVRFPTLWLLVTAQLPSPFRARDVDLFVPSIRYPSSSSISCSRPLLPQQLSVWS